MKRSRSVAEMTSEDLDFVGEDQMNVFGDIMPEELADAVFEDYRRYYSSLPLETTQTCSEHVSTAAVSTISPAAYVNQCNDLPQTHPRRSTAHDHIIAERKRREKLSQQFIALAAIVPGLKKMDKTSVLGDCIEYIKKLQEREKTLEEETAKETIESVVFVKQFQARSTNENSVESSNKELPEIETTTTGRNVVIRIHCEKQRGVLVKALDEIEKSHLSVISSSTMLFGSSTLNITVLAQMEDEFNISVKDLAKKLLSAFRQFM